MAKKKTPKKKMTLSEVALQAASSFPGLAKLVDGAAEAARVALQRDYERTMLGLWEKDAREEAFRNIWLSKAGRPDNYSGCAVASSLINPTIELRTFHGDFYQYAIRGSDGEVMTFTPRRENIVNEQDVSMFSRVLMAFLRRASEDKEMIVDAMNIKTPELQRSLSYHAAATSSLGPTYPHSLQSVRMDLYADYMRRLANEYRDTFWRTNGMVSRPAVEEAVWMFYHIAGYPCQGVEWLDTPLDVVKTDTSRPAPIEAVVRGLAGTGSNLIRRADAEREFNQFYMASGIDRALQNPFANAWSWMLRGYSASKSVSTEEIQRLNSFYTETMSGQRRYSTSPNILSLKTLAVAEMQTIMSGVTPYSYAWTLHALMRFILQNVSAIVFTTDRTYCVPLPDAIWTLADDEAAVSRLSTPVAGLNTRLHRLNGPAIYWQNLTMYAYKGVIVPKQVIMEPQTITAQQAINEPNAEVRRVMFEIVGAEKLLRDLHATQVAKDEFGTLYRMEVNRPNGTLSWPSRFAEVIQIVQVTNATPNPDGTYKDYYMLAHPSVRTPHEAVAQSFKMTASDYHPSEEA